MPAADLSLSEARRLALAATGLDGRRPAGRVGKAALRRTLARLGLLQIDFVNLVVPAHYQVPFSRLGAYDRTLLDELVYGKREFLEGWAHEASIVPADCWPLLRHRRETHRVRPWGFEALLERHPDYVASVREAVRARGPLAAEHLPGPDGSSRRLPGTWYRSVPRATLEALFGRGELAVAARLPNFARTYDLAERVVTAEHFERHVAPDEARRELLRRAARSLGVASAADLADYYRMTAAEARPRLAELVASGELLPVRVEGWRQPAYLHPEAQAPGRLENRALLSPFDPLIWTRARAARLFGFHYRLEIFVPPAKRRWGAYVLPFLLGERLVARLDLKADRARSRLRVLGAYLEEGCDAREVAEALEGELRSLAAWIGLDGVAVGRRGGLARPLGTVMRSRS